VVQVHISNENHVHGMDAAAAEAQSNAGAIPATTQTVNSNCIASPVRHVRLARADRAQRDALRSVTEAMERIDRLAGGRSPSVVADVKEAIKAVKVGLSR
jgi:hypothetical protein